MRSVLLVVLCFFCFASRAETKDSFFQISKDYSLSIIEYLIENGIDEVFLKTNMKTLQKNKYNEVYQDAEFSFVGIDSALFNFPIKIRTRGNMRKRVCQYPSLKLNFSKSDLKNKEIKPIDKYKLVCQCASGKPAELLLLKEFLAYNLYNIVTDNSFKTHLFTINYIDTRGKKTRVRYGFLIENEKELTSRLDGTVVSTDSMRFKDLIRENIIQMGMFQYMIGTTDFSLKNMHNLNAIQPVNTKNALLIAYDFDSSGLVDAIYAVPNPKLPIRDVKDRWFNIKGCSRKEIQEQVDHFEKYKKEILAYSQNYTILNSHSHKTSLEYIEAFFEIIEDSDEVKERFVHK